MDDFDHVVTNPPFQPRGRGRASPSPARSRARTEQSASLEQWISGCRRRLRTGGTLTAIFPADRLDHLLGELGKGAGDLRVFPLWPKAGRAAKRVIVRARRGSHAPMRLLSGMVLHEADGRIHHRGREHIAPRRRATPCRLKIGKRWDQDSSGPVLAARPISVYLERRRRSRRKRNNRRTHIMALSTIRATPPISWVPFLGISERLPVVAVCASAGSSPAARVFATASTCRVWGR